MTTEEKGTEQQVETPTIEQQLEDVKAEAAKYQKLADEKDKGLRTAHQTLTQRDRELKEQRDLRTYLDSLDQKIRILAAAQATGMKMDSDSLENMSPQVQQNLLDRFDKLDADTKAKEEQAKKQAEENEYRSKADQLWQEAQSLDIPEDTLDRIEDSLMYGRLDRAERLIERNRKTESKEDVDKLVAQRVKEELEKQGIKQEEEGLLETDTAVPSGRTASQQDIIDRFASGDRSVSRAEYEKAMGLK